jgi:hypothetical protein
MIDGNSRRECRACDVLPIILVIGASLALGTLLTTLMVDDAFILYRYAHNLARGLGFTYNPGSPILSATSPLYTLLLGGLALTGAEIPAIAHWLCSLCIMAAGASTYLLGRRESAPLAGALAAPLLTAFPLLWMSLGLETSMTLALVLWSVYFYRSERLTAAAVLAGLAAGVRPDAILLAAVLVVHLARRCLRRGSGPLRGQLTGFLRPAFLYLAILGATYLSLAVYFGSPLPVTLKAKAAQSSIGVTGFYPYTTFLEGLLILFRAYVSQSPLYLVFVPLALVGAWRSWRRARWAGILIGWGALHAAAYALIGVAPYYWYYVPLVPGGIWLVSLGAEWMAEALGSRLRSSSARAQRWLLLPLAIILLLPLAHSHLRMVSALDGPVPPPDEVESKVLPEAKSVIYRQAGQWLHDNTPSEASVGVTELGIIGFYADRTMLDFLGLLEPDVAQALARGDPQWALLKYQPDYLVLTAISPLYDYGLREDPWFQATYAPIQEFRSDRFWGSPVTIYARQNNQVASHTEGDAVRLDAQMEHDIRLLGYTAPQRELAPGEAITLALYWEALSPVETDYTVFVHLLGRDDRVIAQRDAPPALGSEPTSQWIPGQPVTDLHLMALPPQAYAPDTAQWEVGLYDSTTGSRLLFADGADNVRFGHLEIVRPERRPELTFESGPTLEGYQLNSTSASPGDEIRVDLRWRLPQETDLPYRAVVQLVSESGQIEAESTNLVSEADDHVLHLRPDLHPSAYDLDLRIVDLASSRLLPPLGADGLPQGDGLTLTKVRVWPD